MKICTECKRELPEDLFYWRKPYNRYDSKCKECVLKNCKKWRDENPEHKTLRRERYHTDEEYNKRIKKNNRDYNRRHKDKIREKNKEYVKTHGQELRAYKRRHDMKIKYNMTPEDFDKLWESQDGKCLGCNIDLTFKVKGGCIVDHDHKTGKVRGLLCNNCNAGLGFLKDDLTVLRNLTNYLEAHSGS